MARSSFMSYNKPHARAKVSSKFFFWRKINHMTELKFKTIAIDLNDLHPNTGQIEGVPANPRFIRDKRFRDLRKSIKDAPEMMSLREILVYDNDGEFVVIGGNMRFRAMQDLKFKNCPCKVLDVDTPSQKLREYVIKDNVAFGQNDFDMLANEWDEIEIKDWGIEIGAIIPEAEESKHKSEGESFWAKMTFDTQEDFNRFMDQYGSILTDEFNFTMKTSG